MRSAMSYNVGLKRIDFVPHNIWIFMCVAIELISQINADYLVEDKSNYMLSINEFKLEFFK